jgi:membrane protein
MRSYVRDEASRLVDAILEQGSSDLRPELRREVRVDQSRRRIAELRRRAEPAVRRAQAGLPGRILGRLVEVSFLDRTVILGAQAFSAVLPLFIVVSTVSPHPGGDTPATVLARKVGFGPGEVSSLRPTIAPPSSARASIGVLGVLLALLTATSFARALQRSYELAWRLPPAGMRAAWRPLALAVGFAVYVELVFLFGRMVRGVPASTLLEDLVTFVGGWVLWTGAGWILLVGRVRPRLLAAGGLLTAVGFAALRRLAALYLPSLVVTNQQRYGLLGVAFTLFSWLSACAFVIVVATVVGAVLAQDPGRLGRFVRTPGAEGLRRRGS